MIRKTKRCEACRHVLVHWGGRLHCPNAQCPGPPVQTELLEDVS